MNYMAVNQFSDVTLLITHYNRSRSLERLLRRFRQLQFEFGGIVVSDDGSRAEHLDRVSSLQREFEFHLVTTPQNRGLGNNINKGQDAVTTPYTLYVQEDFEPSEIFSEHFRDALQFMKEDSSLDIVRFYAYFKYPVLKSYGKGFSEMVYKWWHLDHLKVYMYSDHPHLRRSAFFEKFGRYPENLRPDRTEYTMAVRFIQQGGRGLFFDEFTTLFFQKNEGDETSTIGRVAWRQRKDPFTLFLRWIYLKYRWLKTTLDVGFKLKK